MLLRVSGKHTYPSKHQDLAERRHGAVSDRTVSRILNVLKENADTVIPHDGLARKPMRL